MSEIKMNARVTATTGEPGHFPAGARGTVTRIHADGTVGVLFENHGYWVTDPDELKRT